MRNCLLILILLPFLACTSKKKEVTFSIEKDSGSLIDKPISVSIGNLDISQYVLLNNGQSVPFDWDKDAKVIWFVRSPSHSREYTFSMFGEEASKVNRLSAQKDNGTLTLSIGKEPRVGYKYGMHYPPNGVDSIFKKSGFIHPLITPSGDTLTRINPPDHWHHYGIWGPWTHTRIDTVRVDFWNIGDGNGTVLHKEFKDESNGQVTSSFTAVQEHIDLKTENSPQIALEEELEVKIWNLNNAPRYIMDYTSTFSSPLKNGILFEAYRYGGGIGMRFTERWKKDNCKVLTSEGNDRLTADGTNAKWAIVSGEASDGKGTNGILFLSHSENRMHPEPMRVWPIDGNGGRGDMFFEFCPIRHEPWQIKPNEAYQLKYRMVIFEGELSPEEAEAYWNDFVDPTKIELEVN
ncbi:hypothetical protein DZC72_04130 [Maribacter algicola]|uniref:Methane oxygenase PmoA n=1 Tax=Maribacter algicola TaxID=2498892 RepID=A0A426RL99_9FLAO|nr:PmoA family protein [Maribacter algicola]RRQ49787.1 hypothetical protein DZC72_04130 [Maribacter algicola]